MMIGQLGWEIIDLIKALNQSNIWPLCWKVEVLSELNYKNVDISSSADAFSWNFSIDFLYFKFYPFFLVLCVNQVAI